MKINYGLIVSDFDGTLIDDRQRILPEVKEAIDRYIKAGGIFAVCTGRMLCSILPQVRALGLKGPVIAYQGTVIADIETGNVIKSGRMKYEEVSEICRNIEKLGYGINIYNGDNMYTDIPKENKYLVRYEKIIGVEAKHVDGKISDFVLKNKLDCQKVLSLVKEGEREFVYSELSRLLGHRFDVTCSASVLVEVSPMGDTKGEALKFLAKHYGIPIGKTVAVGDNLNDLSMIKAAGIGCAVSNATTQLKEAADFVSVSNNDGALAQIIYKYGFE